MAISDCFFALYDDQKSTFAISSEIPSYFFPGQCQSTGNPGKKHCNLWTAQEKQDHSIWAMRIWQNGYILCKNLEAK